MLTTLNNKAELHLTTDRSFESIAIIGGGIASAFLADALLDKAPNINITIYCQDEQLAAGASGNEQGAVYPHLQGSLSTLAQVGALSFDFAVSYYKTLQQRLSNQFDIEFCGVLQQAHTPDIKKRLAKVHEVWSELTQWLDAEQSSQISGVTLPYPSLWFEDGCWLSPKQLTRALIADLDLELKLNCKIAELVKSETNWTLKSESGERFSHDAVVVCGGFASSSFSQSRFLPIEPIRGQVSQLSSSSSLSPLKVVLCHKGYVTPTNNELQCFGATFQKNVVDTQTAEKDDQTNLEQIQSVYSQQDWSQSLKLADIKTAKAGIRANSPDHCPIVGEVFSPKWIAANINKNTGYFNRGTPEESENAGLYVLSGLGARGLTTGPLMAKQLTSIMLDNEFVLPPELTQATSPNRFLVRQLKRSKGQHPWFDE